jgi:hypothetical protein
MCCTLAAMTDAPSHGWRPDDSTFGARLALVRQWMNWGNVTVAAQQCGIPVESWRSWERDNAQPRNLLAVCSAIHARTGVELGWLAGLPAALAS